MWSSKFIVFLVKSIRFLGFELKSSCKAEKDLPHERSEGSEASEPALRAVCHLYSFQSVMPVFTEITRLDIVSVAVEENLEEEFEQLSAAKHSYVQAHRAVMFVVRKDICGFVLLV